MIVPAPRFRIALASAAPLVTAGSKFDRLDLGYRSERRELHLKRPVNVNVAGACRRLRAQAGTEGKEQEEE